MDHEDRLTELHSELANLTDRIEAIRAEVEPTSFKERRQEMYRSGDWTWLDSIGWVFLWL
jgi:hypothetical protein